MKKLNLIIRKIGRCTEEDLTGQDDKKSVGRQGSQFVVADDEHSQGQLTDVGRQR